VFVDGQPIARAKAATTERGLSKPSPSKSFLALQFLSDLPNPSRPSKPFAPLENLSEARAAVASDVGGRHRRLARHYVSPLPHHRGTKTPKRRHRGEHQEGSDCCGPAPGHVSKRRSPLARNKPPLGQL